MYRSTRYLFFFLFIGWLPLGITSCSDGEEAGSKDVVDTTMADTMDKGARAMRKERRTVENLKPLSDQELLSYHQIKTRSFYRDADVKSSNLIKSETFDREGRLVSVAGGESAYDDIADTLFTYNEKGQLIRKEVKGEEPWHTVFVWADDQKTREKDYEGVRLMRTRFFYYSKSGRLDRYTVVEEDCEECNEVVEVVSEYDNRGRLGSQTTYKRDPEDTINFYDPMLRREFFYNKKGLVMREERQDFNYSSYGRDSETFYRYNSKRQMIEKTFKEDRNGWKTRSEKLTLGEGNLPVKKEIYLEETLMRTQYIRYTQHEKE